MLSSYIATTTFLPRCRLWTNTFRSAGRRSENSNDSDNPRLNANVSDRSESKSLKHATRLSSRARTERETFDVFSLSSDTQSTPDIFHTHKRPFVIRKPFRTTRIHSTLMDTNHISRAMMTGTTFHARRAHRCTTRGGCESDAACAR